MRYVEAAEYWRKAAALPPEVEERGRTCCLNAAGYDTLAVLPATATLCPYMSRA